MIGHPNFRRYRGGELLRAKDLTQLADAARRTTIQTGPGKIADASGFLQRLVTLLPPAMLRLGKITEISGGEGPDVPTTFTYKGRSDDGQLEMTTFERPLMQFYNNNGNVLPAPVGSRCIMARCWGTDPEEYPKVHLIIVKEELFIEDCSPGDGDSDFEPGEDLADLENFAVTRDYEIAITRDYDVAVTRNTVNVNSRPERELAVTRQLDIAFDRQGFAAICRQDSDIVDSDFYDDIACTREYKAAVRRDAIVAIRRSLP